MNGVIVMTEDAKPKFKVGDPVHIVETARVGLFYAGRIQEMKYLIEVGRRYYIYKVSPELDGCRFDCWVEEDDLRLSLVD